MKQFSIFILLSFTNLYADYSYDGRMYLLDEYYIEEKSVVESLEAEDFLNNLKSVQVPNELDLMDIMTSVKDQGNRGSCAFFSTTALLESALCKFGNLDDINLSEEYLIWYEKAVNGHNSNSEGSSGRWNINAFHAGYVLEQELPYNLSWFMKGLPCEDKDISTAPSYCFSHDNALITEDIFHRYNLDFDVLNVSAYSGYILAIMARDKLPVVVAVPVHQKGWNTETGLAVFTPELKAECDVNPSLCGGHSILLTGYDRNKRIFYFKNSWASDWGDGGFGTIGFDYIDRYAYSGSFTIRILRAELPENNDSPEGVLLDFQVFPETHDTEVAAELSFAMEYTKFATAYVSTFLLIEKNSQASNEEERFDFIKMPYGGSYLASRRAFYFSDNNVLDYSDEAIFLKLQLQELNIEDLLTKALYLRTSIYYSNDESLYNLLKREYTPFNL